MKEPADTEGCARVCGYDGGGAICNPSLDPGGVSSAAEADADALVEGGCDTESFNEGAYPADRGVFPANGFAIVFEVVLVRELAEAEILECC